MSDEDRRHDRDPAEEPEEPGSRAGGDAPDDGSGAAAGRSERDPGTERAGDRGEAAAGAGEDGDGDERSGPAGWSGAISEMQNLVGDVVGEVLEGVRGAAGRRFPRVDMVRRPDGDYVVLVDLPGVERDRLKVTTLGGELTIAGERPRPELDEGSEVLRTERGYGSFRRTLRLPPDIREEDVSARLEEGDLEVRLPRKAPSDERTVDVD